MGFIYKVTNKTNGKVYIGQTKRTLEVRWHEHQYYASVCERLPYYSTLYSAIRKYGVEAFTIEAIEECDNSLLNEREIYWIKEYDSVKRGYNLEYGGYGWLKCDDEEIMQLWNDGKTMIEISEVLPLHPETISRRLQLQGITQKEIIARGNEHANRKKSKPVYQYSLDGDFIREFPSLRAAQEYIGKGKRIKFTPNMRMKSFYGYQWRKYKADNIGAVPKKSKECQRSNTGDISVTYRSN